MPFTDGYPLPISYFPGAVRNGHQTGVPPMTNDLHNPRRRPRSLSHIPGFSGLGSIHLSIRIAAVVLLLIVSGLAGGMVIERYVVSGGSGHNIAFPNLEAMSDVINKNYYYLPTAEDGIDELDHRMEQHAIIGALSALDDQYTRYLTEDQSATSQEDLQGHYGGTGVNISMDNGLVVVTKVIPDSPSEEAGIAQGDVIEKINNQPVDAQDFEGIVRQLRGDIGATVDIELMRPSTGRDLVVNLTLEEIVVPPVTMRMIEDTSIGWIRVTIFGDDTVAELDDAIATLNEHGATGALLDLRGNGGGWVTSAQSVLGRFLDPDTGPALYEDASPGPGGEVPLPILVDETTRQIGLPVIVLVDDGTASAAEIVAGALQDYGRALVVGEPTYGKGSVQRIFSFPDGSTLRVTVAEWFTPDKGRIQEDGIQPDIVITASDQTPADQDLVLDTAATLLRDGVSRPADLISTPGTEDSLPVTPER